MLHAKDQNVIQAVASGTASVHIIKDGLQVGVRLDAAKTAIAYERT